MKCPECKQSVKDTFKFCPECGEKLCHVQLEASDGKSPEQRSQHCDAVKQNPLEAPLLPRTEVPSDLCHTSQSGATQFDNKDATGTAKNRTCSLEKNEPQVDYQSSCLSMTDVSTSFKTAQTITQPSSIIQPVSQSNIHSLQSEPVVPSEEAATLALQDKGSKDTLLIGVKCQESETITSQTLVPSSSGTSTESTRGPDSKEFQSSEDHTNAETTSTANTSSSKLTQTGHSYLPPSSLKNQPAVKPTHPENESLQKVIPGQEQPLISCTNPSSTSGSVNIGNGGKSSNENKSFTAQQSAGIQHADGSANTTNKEKCSTHHSTKSKDLTTEKQQSTNQSNKPKDQSTITDTKTSKGSMCTDGGKNVPENRKHSQDPQNKDDVQQPQTEKITQSKAVKPQPQTSQITVFFHAVLSKDFGMDPSKEILTIGAGMFPGSWNENVVKMEIARDVGYGFLVHGQLQFSKYIVGRAIPYKYVIHRNNYLVYEHIYKEDRNIANRSLFIRENLLTHQGEWHQYDDMIYPPPSEDLWKRISSWFFNMRQRILRERCLTGQVMLETIFGLLPEWNKTNVQNFFVQLKQFFRSYSNPYIYEEYPKPWLFLQYGEEEVKTLLNEFMQRRLFLPLQSEGKAYAVLPDCVKAGIIILLVCIKYRLRHDPAEIQKVCQLLCFPAMPKDKFSSYWSEVMQALQEESVLDALKTLYQKAIEKKTTRWILILPHLHFLKGESKPFEPNSLATDQDFDTWAGLKGIKMPETHLADPQHTRALIKIMETHKYLLDMDLLLSRSWMCLLGFNTLWDYTSSFPVDILDILVRLNYGLLSTKHFNSEEIFKPVLAHLFNKTKEAQHRFKEEEYAKLCLKTSVTILEKMCTSYKDPWKHDIPLACLKLLNFIINSRECHTKQEFTDGKVMSKNAEVFKATIKIVREWLQKTFTKPLLTCSHDYTDFTNLYEMEVWNNLITFDFTNEGFQSEWKSTFLKQFKGKFEKAKSIHQIEIYCNKIDEVTRKFPVLSSCLENCALAAVTSVCRNKSEKTLFEKLKEQDLSKFGKLISAIVLKAWPKTENGKYQEGLEAVIKHLLTWPTAKNVLQLQGANGMLIHQLSDDAKELMAMACSAFSNVAEEFIQGNITLKILKDILEEEDTFIEFLNIDGLCADGRCRNKRAVKSLLRKRRDEIEDILQEKEMVKCLLSVCQSLPVHIKVNAIELEDKQKSNIDLIPLDEFMEVHQLDDRSSDVTGVVTFFSISDTIKKMARTLHALRESYIFMECWNSQVREVSGNLQADDENQTQLLCTLDQLHQNIFQPCFNKFEEIYTCLKDGTITFQMIDSVFENLKGNHGKIKEDLDIMCNINPKDYKQWTKRRTEQIQQYHDLHSAVKSAEVIMEVKEIVCPEGNFQVLKRLHDISRADFKDESLDQIDENLISTKEVLADITEARRECLQELGKRRNFVQWVKETLKEINDLKVFVDLASISAGENDMDVDRVACFHDAVLGYSSVLYGLTFDSDFDEFQKTLQKLWQALENDSNITNKLRDSARHLDWLKTVKESHGSVELSSMSLVKTINDKGSYIISVKNQKKLLLENVIRLHVIEEHEEGPEVRCYSLEDMIDLQNKLMLMTGKAEQGTHEVEHFMEVFDHVQRLAKAFINLLAAGNPLFRKWEAKIKCNNKSNPGITVDLNLSTVQNEIQLNGNASGQLSVLCRKMEGYLSEWRNFMDKQRCGNYYLNYYTAEQIMCLCENLCQKNVNTYLKEDVLMMLSFVNPKCTTSDIWNIWNKVFTDLAETLDSPNTQGKVSFLDNQLVTKADDIETLDRFWYDYTRDMKSFLPDTLDIPSLGKLLEKLANTLHCNDEDEAMEEFMPLDPQDKQITRQFPRGLLEGRPNLIVCPHNEVLPSCISIYCNSAYEALPTYDEVLLCSLATSYEYVELFLRRCLTKGYTGKKIYSLLFADQLSYEVSYATEQLFQRLNLQGKTDYQLVIICSSEYEHAYIPSAFSQFKLHMVPREALQRIQTYLSRHYTVPHQNSAGTVFKDKKCVGIVSSKRAGVGKSLYIQRLYEKLEEFSGSDTSFLRCIRLNEHIVDENAVLQSLQETPNQDGLVIFHFDVTTSVQKGLHEFLFKLLVLGYLMDTEGHMWKCSKQHLYVIEMLQCNSEPLQFAQKKDAKGAFSFLEIFPKIQCRPPKEVLEMEIELEDDPTLEIEDPLMDDQHFSSEAYQRPYQYLRRFHEGVDLDNFTFSGVEGSHVECLQMLFFYCGIVDPSWAELKNFVWFLNLQLQDCETSDFCNMELVGDTLRGFRNFVVDFMILMAKDFATPSLTISDQSPGRHQADLQGDNEEDLAPFRIRKRWESEPHPYIFFNDDHVSMTFIGFHLKINDQKEVDAIDPNTNKVIRKNIMTKALYDGLVHQRVPFNIDFHNLERYEKIEHLCSVMGIKWPTDPEETYELTMDNILKMMAIHMRFRCGIPVVVMGETGCGKTRLIKFLCDLRRGGEDVENLKLVKVHGGTTPDMIYNTVKKAETIAISNKQDHGFDTVLFFDEANTTEAISCIKEVLCDKTIKGQKLDPQAGLQIIAACNPYRKHSDEMIGRLEAAGLGYKVRTAETEDRLGSIPLRQLVYRVHLLPPSLIPLVWDFGQLNDFTEQLYINQIVQNVTRTNLITENYVEMITDILSASQDYMRKRTDECSFVSLRDVERCMKVFVWFYGNHNMFFEELENFLKDKTHQSKKHAGGIDPTDNRKPVEWSLLMAVAVCYSSCLENKNQFWTKISKFFPSYNKVSLIMQEISLMQDLLLSGVPLGDTIAKNKALKENVFMMVVCIELRIPLFLVGKPGSSKSLSKTLVADAMQGQAAHSELYKRFKQIHLVSYQCSPHSTAEGIISTFKQCARFQEGKNLKEYISVVVLDEIGLAEDSPKMPLKTLHPLLEEGCIDDDPLPHKKVGFIGISNWALDPAKMNRGIFVSRGDPDENELIESAKGICSSNKIVLENIKPFFQHFAVAYSKICLKQKEGFFGLRDFYSLIKMVFVASKVSSPSEEQIIEAVLRNFSGWDDVDAVQIFSEELLIQPNLDKVCTVDLVRQNIDTITQDGDCRYLLILTKNFAALQILQQTFFKDDNLPEIIFGSSFPKDQEYTQICKNINRVKICMETGRTVVLLNLQNLYESLYDALNQYYVTMGGQKYVDLGLGTHRVKCRVHKDFRLIVIEEKEVVYSQFPIPLINRLEKHYLDINSVLNINQRAIVKDLQSWVEKFVSFKNYHYSTHTYTPSDVFVGYHSDTCSSVVLQVMDKLKDDTEDLDTEEVILQEAKFALMNCATPDSVVRLEYSDLSDAETKELIHIYFQRQSHYSLSKFIASHIQQEQHVHSVFTEITTFSRLLTAADVRQLQSITGEHNIDLLSLQQFETEFSFLRRLKDFLQKTYGDRILLVQIDFDDSSVSANILASARYSTINEITKSEDSDGGRVFVCFITKLPRMDSRFSYKGFQGGHWMSVHIDDLRSSKDMASDIQTLSNLSICELFEEKTELLKKLDNVEHDQETISDNELLVPETEHSASMEIFDNTALVRSCIQSALSMLRDPEEGGRHGTRRLDTLLTLLENTDELRATFIETLRRRLHLLLKTHEEKVHMPKNWVSREASNIGALQEGGTFKHTLWRRIQIVIIPLLAHLISVIDRNCNLDLLLDENCNDEVKNLWLLIFGNKSLLDIPYVQSDQSLESETILIQSHISAKKTMSSAMPFSWRIKELLDDLWVHILQREGQTQRQFEDVFKQTVLGEYFSKLDVKTHRDFFQRYLQDFVVMTMKVTKVAEQQLLCEALASCVNELSGRAGRTMQKELTLTLVHTAYNEFQNRLQNFSRMISILPPLAFALQDNPHVMNTNEMVLDVFCALACVEHLEPKASDSEFQWQLWLKQVKRLQVPIELVCSEHSIKHYGERSREIVVNIHHGWNRIFILSIFVKHVLSGIESEDERLKPLITAHIQHLGKVLEKSSDMKQEKTFVQVITILKSCKQSASELNFKFGLQSCSICMTEPKEPVELPCNHIFCRHCLRNWLTPDKMFCAKCTQQVPDDFQIKVSEEIQGLFKLNGQFRQRCNAFFIELVSTLCFKDNSPPSRGVILHLLSFLMIEAKPASLVQAQSRIHTKDLSPFDECVDSSPIVRSVVLKLLLKYSFDEVQEYLQQHLTEIEASKILDGTDKTGLYTLYINCLEDSMFKKKHLSSESDQMLHLKEGSDFLRYFLDSGGAVIKEITIETLQQIARLRLCLDMAAQLISVPPGASEEHQIEFMQVVLELCERSGNDWYRVYLIRKVSSSEGMEVVQNMLRRAELQWLFPQEVLLQDGNNEAVQMDQYLVYGDVYQAVREAVAKALMEGRVEDINQALENFTGPPRKGALYILLALYREVTTLYRVANPALHPTREQCQFLEGFIQSSRYLVTEEIKLFATALVNNKLDFLMRFQRTGTDHFLTELIIHLNTVLLCGPEDLLAPLKQLGLSPENMQMAFIPTMPEDMLATAQKTLGFTWYACPNGHPCVVDKCGRPMQRGRCLECGAEIGGESHRPVQGFTKIHQQGDRTQTGHILGDPLRRDNPDSLDTKSLSLTPFILVRMLTHLTMLLGASQQPQSQYIAQIIKPAVQNPCEFLMQHLQKDLEQLGKALGKGADETVTTAHLLLSWALEPPQAVQWPARYNNTFSTKDARNAWELTFANDIITPKLKKLEQKIEKVNTCIRNDSRVSSNPILKLVFGDPRLFLSALPQDSSVYSSAVWSCRKESSLLSLTHIVEQNDGKDSFPLLWRFLQKEAQFRLIKFLPDIVALQRNLVKKFQNLPDGVCGTIKDFIQRQTSVSARKWFEKRIQIFLSSWNQLRVSLANYEINVPGDYCSVDLNEDSELQVLIPRRKEAGLCATALLSYLVSLHNQLIDAVDKHTEEDSIYTVSLAELSELHVIGYEEERDLLPLIVSNCQYTMECGHVTVPEYDLAKIQQQIFTQFLQGKPHITLLGIPTLISRQDRNYESIFKDITEKVPQEPLTSLCSAGLVAELQSLSDVCEALTAVEVSLGFLAMTGEDGSMSLEEYMINRLQMGKQTAPHILKTLSRCSLKHCVALWQLLMCLRSEYMLRLKRDPFTELPTEYKDIIGEEQKALTVFVAKSKPDIWLLEMHEFLLLKLKNQHAKDTFKPEWSLKDTLASYMERKNLDVPLDVEEYFPDEIQLSQSAETWKFIVTVKHQDQR